MIEIHISKAQIENSRGRDIVMPYVQVVNTKTGQTEYGHTVRTRGPVELVHRKRRDGERHVYLITEDTVLVDDENLDQEREVS